MTKVKTSELQGAALDYAVAKCKLVGKAFSDSDAMQWASINTPSTNWSQGGPIIEREAISTRLGTDSQWAAYKGTGEAEENIYWNKGNSPLVAAMRCYVASKLGDVVDIPDELV